MADSGFLAVFLVGLLGGTHCVGMCGGIVSALSLQPGGASPSVGIHLAYSTGRIASYAFAGAIVGAAGSTGLALSGAFPVQIAFYVVANLMLIAMGLYLGGWPTVLAFTERLGYSVWRYIQPLSRRLLPVRHPAQALAVGAIWGWLPCGLVYSVLTSALASGSASRGAALMTVFGLGTLPNLMFAGLALARIQGVVRRPLVRLGAAAVVITFGLYGLWGAYRLLMSVHGT